MRSLRVIARRVSGAGVPHLLLLLLILLQRLVDGADQGSSAPPKDHQGYDGYQHTFQMKIFGDRGGAVGLCSLS